MKRYMGVVFPYLNMIDPCGLLIAASPRRRRGVYKLRRKNSFNAAHGVVANK